MFKNPILEFLSISGPIMMTTFHSLIISLLLYMSAVKNPYLFLAQGVLVFGLAMLTWTFAECVLHRYVFHFIKEDSKLVKDFHYTPHGYHHQVPDDANRLFMPLVPATLILSLFLGLFYLLMQDLSWIFLDRLRHGIYALFLGAQFSAYPQRPLLFKTFVEASLSPSF